MTAVLFDFSGTLFRVESTESWLRGAWPRPMSGSPRPS